MPRLRMAAMADMRQRARDQRRVLRDRVGAFGLRVTRERADLDRPPFAAMSSSPLMPLMSISRVGRGQPHVERGDQALPAGEQTGVLVLAEQRDRFVERPRAFVGEWRRLHVVVLPEVFFLIVTGNAGSMWPSQAATAYKAPHKIRGNQ